MVAPIDNVLKPLVLGRGVVVPTAVVFLGVIGGFLAMGIIGLFVGAIVLSVMRCSSLGSRARLLSIGSFDRDSKPKAAYRNFVVEETLHWGRKLG